MKDGKLWGATIPQWVSMLIVLGGFVWAGVSGVATKADLQDYVTVVEHEKAFAAITSQTNLDRALVERDREDRDKYRREASARERRITTQLESLVARFERMTERMTRTWRGE